MCPGLYAFQRFSRESLSCFGITRPGEIKINSTSSFINRPIERTSRSFYFRRCLTNLPAITEGRLYHRNCLYLRKQTLNPAEKSCVLNFNTPFKHHFFKTSVADAILTIPSHISRDNTSLIMTSFEITQHFTSTQNTKLNHKLFTTGPFVLSLKTFL